MAKNDFQYGGWNSYTLQCGMWLWSLDSWQWIHQLAAPCNVTHGSGMTCHWIRANVCHTGILHLVSISTHHRSRHVILHQSVWNFIQIGPSSAEKTTCQFSRWRISAIFDFRGPIMGSLKSPFTTSYRSSIETIALNCLDVDVERKQAQAIASLPDSITLTVLYCTVNYGHRQ